MAGFPISLVGLIALIFDGQNTPDPIAMMPFVALFAIMSVALVMLGYLVQADLPEQISVEPASA